MARASGQFDPGSRPQDACSRFRKSTCRPRAFRSEVITDFEKRLIETTLEAAGGVKRAAELLHIKPTTLNEMIKRYDIRPRRRRAGEPDSSSQDDNGHGGPNGPAAPSVTPSGGRRTAAGFADE
jgi:hypothetical protein